MEQKQKSHIRPIVYVMISVFLIIGYAYLTSSLTINGSTLLKKATWDVHFENVQVKDGSVTGEQVTQEPEIDSEQTTVSFHVNLKKPGDYYEFTVDAVNAGTIDAMINSYTEFDLTEDQLKYLETSVTYEDGEEIAEKQQLLAGDFAIYKIVVSFKKDLEADDLPSSPEQLDLEFTVEYVQKDNTAKLKRSDRNIYNIFKREFNNGTLIKKYNGEHQDSMDASLSTKDIYLWNASTSDNVKSILEKNNVIFAGKCWQITRTTDTGGIRLIYNGDAVNEECLDNREKHVGYTTYDSVSLNDSIYYSDSYYYDSSQNKIFLGDNVSLFTSSINQPNDILGKYTCNLSSADQGCSTLYLIDRYESNNNYLAFSMSKSQPYALIGKTPYNYNMNTLAASGYMNNKVYRVKGLANNNQYLVYYQSGLNYNKNNWYSDDIEWDSTTSTYRLINPYKIDSVSAAKFKYTFGSSDENYSSSKAYYVLSDGSQNHFYFILEEGHLLDYYNKSVVYGSSYIDNGDGTYTIEDSSVFELKNQSSSSPLSGKFACFDSVSDTCSDIIYINSSGLSITYSTPADARHFYAGFTYTNGRYVLGGSRDYVIWHPPLTSDINMGYTHYWCDDNSNSCEKVNYSVHNKYPSVRYIELENGQNGDDAINQMLYNEDVNLNSSVAKKAIDYWYVKNLINYSDYLDDTVFCNSREVGSWRGWKVNNPNPATDPLFSLFLDSKSSLLCNNNTDKFSLSNSIAKLTYPIGIPSYSEAFYLGNNSLRVVNGADFNPYWLMTPSRVSGTTVELYTVNYDGSLHEGYSYMDYGIRPMISLKSDVIFYTGDGSKKNPYYIGTIYNVNFDDNTLTIDNVAPAGKEVELTLNSSNYIVTSFKLNGVYVEGNSFVMPSEDVYITEIVKKPGYIIESSHNPYENSINSVTYFEKTFEGATSINIKLTYQTESAAYDWVYLYDDANSSTPVNNRKYGGVFNTENITIDSNYLKIIFKTDGSGNNYYGFKAVVIPNYD